MQAHSARRALAIGAVVCTSGLAFWFGRESAQQTEAALEGAPLTNHAATAGRDSDQRSSAVSQPMPSTEDRISLGTLWAALADARRNRIIQFETYATFRGRLRPTFRKLFELSPDEESRLQVAFDQAHQRMEQLLTAHAVVTQADAQGIVITIEPFSEGLEVYGQLMDAFGEILGPERALVAIALDPKYLFPTVGPFGAERRIITIRGSKSVMFGVQALEISDRRTSTPTTLIDSNFTSLAQLPAEYGWISPVLPASVSDDDLKTFAGPVGVISYD